MANTFHMRALDGSIVRFEYHESCESVQQIARARAVAGFPDRYVVFSEKQTKYNALGEPIKNGEFERGVYMSCILRPSMFPSQVSFFAAMSTVALISVLEEHTTKPLGIGWVSNVYCEGDKIGGVTVEGRLDSFNSYEYIIVSFLVALDESSFPPRLSDLVKKVFESENASVSAIIAKDILSKFLSLYPKVKSPDKFMDLYKQKFILAGVKARYTEAGKRKRCKILSVDSKDCTLIVETRGGEIKHIFTNKNVTIPTKIKLK